MEIALVFFSYGRCSDGSVGGMDGNDVVLTVGAMLD